MINKSIFAGNSSIDNVITSDGVFHQNTCGGNCFHAAMAARILSEENRVAILSSVPENFPESIITSLNEHGIDTSLITHESEKVEWNELFVYGADGERRDGIFISLRSDLDGKVLSADEKKRLLSQKYDVLQTEKNFNNEIGLPRTLLQLTERHEACVVEMGMRGLGQIAELAAIAEPTIGVVTNVGKSHIELLGSQENIAKAKSELVLALDEKGTAVLNADDSFVAPMAALCRGSVLTYGTEAGDDIWAEQIAVSEQGVTFTCHCGSDVFAAQIPAISRHHAYNGLAAAAVGCLTGLSAEEIRRGLAAYKGVPMREELISLAPYTFINDAYNANPASMSAAIRSLGALTTGRKIAVLGGMLELGDWAREEHEAIGREIASSGIDVLITMGELAGYIAGAAREGGMKQVYTAATHDECAACLKELLQPGDTVLLKGSRGFAMEKILSYFERKSCEC